MDPAGLLAGLDRDTIAAILADLSPGERAALAAATPTNNGRTIVVQPHQRPPPGDWDGWVFMAGRDAGKTFAGMAWLADQARTRPGLRARIIAPTLDDAILSCVEGPSGLLTLDPSASFHPSVPGGSRVVWPNGSTVWTIGTHTPRSVDRLRALTNIDVDVFEEAAANPQLTAAVEQAALSRRRAGARWVATTTPRPLPVVKAWKSDPTVVVTGGTSHDNIHGDPQWRAKLEAAYAGTRLYRQEVLGEIVDDVAGARWRYEWLDRSRVPALPDDVALRWAVGVDPASGTGTTGVVAVAIDRDGHVYVTDDASTAGHPAEWAHNVLRLADLRNATIVAEKDQGGRMVGEVLTTHAGRAVPIKSARARSVGDKQTRADAAAILWEKHPSEGHLVGSLPLLEDQLTGWVPGERHLSPDRLDAMVWAILWLRSTAHAPTTVHVPAGTFGGW